MQIYASKILHKSLLYKALWVFKGRLFIIASVCACSQKKVDASTLKEIRGILYESDSSTPFTGVSEEYYDDGQLKGEINFKNGVTHGEVKGYYKNGKLEFVLNVKNGVSNGSSKFYYENGQLQAEGVVKNGIPQGVVKHYNEDGKLQKKSVYKNGELISEEEY